MSIKANSSLIPAGRAPDFEHVEHWVFDLDNTLYPPACDLFGRIDERMMAFIADFLGVDHAEAKRVQKDFYVEHGTTLAGLMAVHGLKPDRFLAYVHDIDVTAVDPNPALGAAIAALPGRKLIFTNGSVAHAENVVRRLGIADAFHDIHDIVTTGYAPKPRREAYERFVAASGIAPERAAMFEDIPRNLEVPHALGMKTVWVRPAGEAGPERYQRLSHEGGDAAHVHHATDDLTAFLGEILRGGLAAPE
ncbi:MAG: pyrimidine 5'-nucleotidase [Parvibaculum sp.]|uniref:pyrimidine 5'-nucleotidase n=1 Tax=Parvibaculum sp. TaxID=2024848 RepID=UPI00284DB043|nr:pyrimidine 5'-nucleotidase [Parvibaculum sp.]MDR3499047.1 pyrimidine 5'-nucleotidase [Parvibaculum sp.]